MTWNKYIPLYYKQYLSEVVPVLDDPHENFRLQGNFD